MTTTQYSAPVTWITQQVNHRPGGTPIERVGLVKAPPGQFDGLLCLVVRIHDGNEAIDHAVPFTDESWAEIVGELGGHLGHDYGRRQIPTSSGLIVVSDMAEVRREFGDRWPI